MEPVCVIATDLPPHHEDWSKASDQAQVLAESCSDVLGFVPRGRVATLLFDFQWAGADMQENLSQVIQEEAAAGARDLLMLPAILDPSLFHRQAVAEAAAAARKAFPDITVHYDDVDVGHPLVVKAFADQIHRSLATTGVEPSQLGLLLTASGHGDSGSRSQSYRLMRLLWEELSFAQGHVAFLRHAQPFLPVQLGRCSADGLIWAVVPQMWWPTEHVEYARVIFDNHLKTQSSARNWVFVEPPRDHVCLSAWLQQRFLDLWQARRRKISAILPSAKRTSVSSESCLRGPHQSQRSLTGIPPEIEPEFRYGEGVIAEIQNAESLRTLLDLLNLKSETVFVKVTWHGYATGTYTDPVALDMLLSALPGRVVILEGHTVSRNLGGDTWDWETEAQQHRTWIRAQELEYLRRTGLADVLRKHKAQYINVTEVYWDGQCAEKEEVDELLDGAGITLNYPELAAFVPRVLLENRGTILLSFARFKGTTRLCISNMFGLLPATLRTAWHGPNITYYAKVCCDLARLYGCLFKLYGMVEGLHVAVRWNRKGLYRSRWGNYDLIPNPNVVTASLGLPAADVLACRLQGGDARRSAFFDVVNAEIGLPNEAVELSLPDDIVQRLA